MGADGWNTEAIVGGGIARTHILKPQPRIAITLFLHLGVFVHAGPHPSSVHDTVGRAKLEEPGSKFDAAGM